MAPTAADETRPAPAPPAEAPAPAAAPAAAAPPKLRHGRKPMYDSDAEADGLNPDVDDEELERGLAGPSAGGRDDGARETDALLGGSSSGNGSFLSRTRARIDSLLHGKKSTRRGKRRDTGAAASTRRRSTVGASGFRAQHPILMRIIYALLALIVLVLVLLSVAVAHLFTVTLKAPQPDAQALILDESLLLRGPDAISLLNISDEGILVRVDGRLGIDPDRALDLWLGSPQQMGFWQKRERAVVEWAVGKLGGVRVELGELRIAEPDWSVDLEEKPLGLLNDTKELSADLLAPPKQNNPDRPPQDLLSFHVQPLIVPLPPLRPRAHASLAPSKDHGTYRAHCELRPLNLTLLFKPVSPAPLLMQVAQAAIKEGKGVLDIKVDSLRVRGLGKKEMDKGEPKGGRWDLPGWINIGENNIRKRISQKVPDVTHGNSTSELLDLKRYEFFEIGAKAVQDAAVAMASRALGIKAYAEAKNPLGRMLHGDVRYSLPFGAFLPTDPEEGKPRNNKTDVSLLAVLATEPFRLTGEKNVSLILEGHVVPPKDGLGGGKSASTQSRAGQHIFAAGQEEAHTADTPSQRALSGFLSRFLSGKPNTVMVRGGNPLPPVANETNPLPGGGSALPEWLDSALRLVDLPISFPGSKVTDLIKNVTINDLKITPHPFETEKLVCSGTVMGIMNLPGQLASLDVQITHLWPDILVFDGNPPSMSVASEDECPPADAINDGMYRPHCRGYGGYGTSEHKHGSQPHDRPEPVPPLPSPLPKGAFGRVRPHNWTVAETYLDPKDPEQKTKLLRSELVDVPITILEGRSQEFRQYTWKILTGGALTGIEGNARAKIWNSGLGALELSNLPVKGVFQVGGGDK